MRLLRKFFARGISFFKSFSLIEYAFAKSFKCSDRNSLPPGQRTEITERIAPESLQKILAKSREVAGHVWVHSGFFYGKSQVPGMDL